VKKILLSLIIIAIINPFSFTQKDEKSDYEIFSFGEGGQIKMLYDRRQRPQSIHLNGKVFIVFNAGGDPGDSGSNIGTGKK